MDIIKQERKRSSKYVIAPTESVRQIGESILGELDTATSFMYLFRRFGAPTATNEDEYKILYAYDLKYKDMLFSIHASSRNHVYFNAWMPKKYRSVRVKGYKEFAQNIAKRSLGNGIYYAPYSTPTNLDDFDEETQKGLNNLFNEKGKIFFSESDYLFLCNFEFKNDPLDFNHNTKYFEMMEPFYESLCQEFRDSLSPDELKVYESWESMDDYPALKKQCEQFFTELLRWYYIRDVGINIKGYERE